MQKSSTARMWSRRLVALPIAAALLCASALTALADPVEINFWDQIWGPPEYAVTAQKLVDQFNASQSGIKVKYRSNPWTNWYETYVTAVASGSAPDLSTGGGFQAVSFAATDAIYPVDELVEQMKADGSAADFAPGALDAMKFNGHYVALPCAIDIRTLFYRKDLLKAKGLNPPTTWAEMQADAKAVTGGKTYGLVSSGDTGGVHWILASSINNGGGLFDTKGKPAMTDGRAKEALDFLSSFATGKTLNPASAGYTNDDAQASFFRGEAAFFLSSPNLIAAAGDAGAQIGMLPPIAGPHGDKGTIYWVNNVMVYKQTKHPKEALAFLKWWSLNQAPLWKEGHMGSIPARLSFQKDDYFQKNAGLKYAIENYIPVAKPMSAPVGGTFPELNAIDGDGFLASLSQKIWQGAPVADAVGPAQKHLEEIMAK